ncbi:hypothetical protein ACWEKT_12855 [Nocardia takedensis]
MASPGLGGLSALPRAVRLVEGALERARGDGSLDARERDEIRGRLAEVISLDELDELIRSVPCLDVAFCRYPHCLRPRRAGTGSGKPPAYCLDGVDEQGRPHTAATAHRRRHRAQAAPVGHAREGGPGGDRPYSVAKAAVSLQMEELLRAFDGLAAKISVLESTYRSLGDTEIHEAEMESVRVQAYHHLMQAESAKLAAEREARELREAARQLALRLEEADAAAEQNALAADTAAAERDSARERARRAEAESAATLEHARAVAEWLVAEARYAESPVETRHAEAPPGDRRPGRDPADTPITARRGARGGRARPRRQPRV